MFITISAVKKSQSSAYIRTYADHLTCIFCLIRVLCFTCKVWKITLPQFISLVLSCSDNFLSIKSTVMLLFLCRLTNIIFCFRIWTQSCLVSFVKVFTICFWFIAIIEALAIRHFPWSLVVTFKQQALLFTLQTLPLQWTRPQFVVIHLQLFFVLCKFEKILAQKQYFLQNSV